MSESGPAVWLVILDTGGLFGAWLDEERARRTAQAVGGVLASVPVAEDYRKTVR